MSGREHPVPTSEETERQALDIPTLIEILPPLRNKRIRDESVAELQLTPPLNKNLKKANLFINDDGNDIVLEKTDNGLNRTVFFADPANQRAGSDTSTPRLPSLGAPTDPGARPKSRSSSSAVDNSPTARQLEKRQNLERLQRLQQEKDEEVKRMQDMVEKARREAEEARKKRNADLNARIAQERQQKEERERVKRMLKEKKQEEEMDAATISFIQRSRESDAEIQRCREALQAIRADDDEEGVMDCDVQQEDLAPAGATGYDKGKGNGKNPGKSTSPSRNKKQRKSAKDDMMLDRLCVYSFPLSRPRDDDDDSTG